MSFADKWEAFDWMLKKQLGRRNLSNEQKTYMIGKMYEARKKTYGGKREMERDEKGHFSASTQNGNLPNKDGRVGEQIAKELGIGNGTVLRANTFAKGIDAIREEFPETADRILKGGWRLCR